jgi:integral membrane sensor domain MASE1
MDIILFGILAGIMLVTLFIGLKTTNPGIIIIGSLGLILLALTLISGSVTYVSGKNITSTETTIDNATVDISTTETYIRDDLQESYTTAFAVFLMFLGIATSVIFIGKTLF